MWVPAAAERRVPYSPPLATAPVTVAGRPRPEGPAAGGLALPTHPIHGALRRGLLTTTEREEVVRVRPEGGRPRRVKVQMGFVVPQAPAAGPVTSPPAAPEPAPVPAAEAPSRLAGPGLLKAHMDLTDLAIRGEGGDGGVAYDLGAALGRLGFVKLAGGGYHPATVREHLRRLAALGERGIGLAGHPTEPLWRFYMGEARGALRPVATPADWEVARRAPRLTAVPGAWLAACEAAEQHLLAHSDLLALPIDGHGHQVERLALLLAAELAAWEAAARKLGPHAARAGLGPLLARAGIADLADLRAETAAKGNGPKRLRSYLAGEGFADEGAFALLRERAGFDVDIADEAAFWAAGRGWVERFWEARVRLAVRGLADAGPLAAAWSEPA